MKPSPSRERRERGRVVLDLPLDYQAPDSSYLCAGIAVDGSEAGLLIHSLQEIPLGTPLDVDVLFADEFELSSFEARGKIVRTLRPENGQKGYGYGVEFLQIDEVNYRKLRRLLTSRRYELHNGGSGLPPSADSHLISNSRGRRPKKVKGSFRSLFSLLLKILP